MDCLQSQTHWPFYPEQHIQHIKAWQDKAKFPQEYAYDVSY